MVDLFFFNKQKNTVIDIFYSLFIMNIALFFWPITLIGIWAYANMKIFLFLKEEIILFFSVKNFEEISNSQSEIYIDEKKHNIRISYLTKIFTKLNKKLPVDILEVANKSKKNIYIYLFSSLQDF